MKKVANLIKIYILRILGVLFLFFLLLAIISIFVKLDKEALSTSEAPTDVSMLNFDENRKYVKIEIEEIFNPVVLDNDSDYESLVYKWESGEDITFEVDNLNGEYEIAIDYMSLQEDVQNISINILVDGESSDLLTNVILPTYWTDSTKEKIYDIYQNEVVPVQQVYKEWTKYFLYDQRYYGKDPLSINLSSGKHTITLHKNHGSLLLGDIYLFEKEKYSNYKEQNVSSNSNAIIIEGEEPLFKSSPDIRGTSSQLTHLSPYSTSKNMINNLSGDSFNESGYSVTYSFDVSEAGYYKIALKYYISQTFTSVYSKILVDNVVAYDELNGYRFDNRLNDRKGSFDYEILSSNGDEMYFYFEKGTHTITLQLDASLQSKIYYELVSLINEINELYLEVIKLTGGNNDKNKTWNIELYIPTAKSRLDGWCERVEDLMELISEVSMSSKAKENRLYQQIKNAHRKLKKLAKEPNKLPSRLNILYEGSSSASMMLSNSLHTSTFNPLSIDKIYVYGSDYKLPKIRNNFFLNYFSVIQRIFRSKVTEATSDVVEIWVNRSTYYVSVMQQFADAYYTPNSGIKVRLSLLPDESKLVYANASNTEPDAALGVGASTPYSLGLRGAICDLHTLSGFSEVIKNFAPGALLNYVEGEKVYGLPETQNFQVTFYRSDILETLNLEVPETYQDIIDILPTLQRYGMNYYMPMAGGSGLKSIEITAPFIYQYGGDIYSADAFEAGIDTKEGIEALTMMVDLFTIYSLPLTTQNFYNDFRTGLSPIGIAGFGEYLQLSNAAPEIQGKWKLALAPGVEQEDGSIRRDQTAGSQAVMIFEKSDKKLEAWDFIKWWLSTDVQSSFANTIQATYGETYLWNTANLNAFKTLAIPEEDKEIILKQWEYIHQVPQTPATYMVERGISNAWNSCVFNQVSVRAAVTDYSLEINREIKRKMQEFGYLDKNGEVIKPYYIPTVDDIKKWIEEGK